MDKSKSDFNVSSIAELKAELYRKQKETKAQLTGHSSRVRPSTVQKKPSLWSKQNAGVLERAQRDLVAKQEQEDVMGRSRSALEAKAKIYEKMSSGDFVPDEDGSEGFLVDFQRKAIDVILEKRENEQRKQEEDRKREKERKEAEEEREALNEPVPEADTPDQQWVDYTDSFGRSRRCLKKDLPEIFKLDRKIQIQDHSENGDMPAGGRSHMSADMRREELRKKWEEEEDELRNRPVGEVHYANVQHDEIRSHGVGFYQFSKEGEERKEQMETLTQLREQTLEQRTKREKLKEKRKAIMEARLAKVKQRKFLREGGTLEEFQLAQQKEAEGKAATPEVSDEMEVEPLTRDETVRQNAPLREWDLGKKVVEIDQWSKTKEDLRNERPEEFAPPQFYYDNSATKNKNQYHKKSPNQLFRKQNKAAERQDGSSAGYPIHEHKIHDAVHTQNAAEMENVADIPLPPSGGDNENKTLKENRTSYDNNTLQENVGEPSYECEAGVSNVSEMLVKPEQDIFIPPQDASSGAYVESVELNSHLDTDSRISESQQNVDIADDIHKAAEILFPAEEEIKTEKKVKRKAAPLPVHYSKPAMPCQPKKYQAPFVPLHSIPQSLPELPPTESAKTDQENAASSQSEKVSSYADWYAQFQQHYTKDFGEVKVEKKEGDLRSANIPFVSPYVVQKEKSDTDSATFRFLPMNPKVAPPGFVPQNLPGGERSSQSGLTLSSASGFKASYKNNCDEALSLEDNIATTLKALRSECDNK